MPQRAAQISVLFNKHISSKSLSELYKSKGITKQMVRKRIGGKNLPPVEVQIEQIAHLKEKMGIVLSQNKVVFFMDCAAFSGENITAGTKIYAKPKH